MTVKQALKAKSKLVDEINKLSLLIISNNSIQEGNVRHYSIKELLDQTEELMNELVELKTKIHKANLPVYGKIFEMSELKNRIKTLNAVSTDEGKQSSRYHSVPEVREVEINQKEMNSIIKSVQNRIDELQDELDVHNATTQI